MLTNRIAEKVDYTNVVDIWNQSVKATHHFLSKKDKDLYQNVIPNFFEKIELMLWYENETLIGFSGVDKQELVMLFLDPQFIGNHYGTQIIDWLKMNRNISSIDVNEQNENALKFYLKQGFEIDSRSEKDGFDKPYPILHLKYRNV
ncbi:GNAT family N-acetyltransferase [Weissella kandleri]|uniref:GNAT family N-acetyltransferase n=1 Tax=Weissella kandleri TaxID=1616 RepID=UPI00387E51AE